MMAEEITTTDETIETLVFLYTSNLQRQEIPRNVTHIRVMDNVQILPVWALSKLIRLEQVEFSNNDGDNNDGFQIIGRNALLGCVSLKILTLPPSTKEIGAGALAGCFQLGSVNLNQGLTSILDSAFQHCRSLVHVRIPPSVKTLGNLVFHGCHSLCLVELPEGLQFLGRSVFLQCNSLTRIFIPSTIIYIGAYCFKDCFQLQSVELPPCGLFMIREEAFRNCPNLRNICIALETDLKGGYDNVLDPDSLLVSKHDDDIPDLDLDLDTEFLEFDESSKQPEKPISIQNRYKELPIHRLCYYQAHWSSMEESEGGTKNIVEEMKQLLQSQDAFDQQDYVLMTPLHILSLSAQPNAKLWGFVYQAYSDGLFAKDKWGKEPLQYLLECSVEDDPSIETILQQAIPARLYNRLELLGEQWRAYFLERIHDLPMGTKTSRRYSANRILELRCKYERMEALSLLESAVWKAQWQRMMTTIALEEKGKTATEVKTKGILESMATKRSDDPAKDGDLDWKVARETCRVQCRSEVVVSNVMQFLDPLSKFDLKDPIALF